MLKGQKRYRKIKPFDIPPGDFVYITTTVAPFVSPYYMISKDGFIYNRYSRKFISWGIDSKGYPYVQLSTDNGMRPFRVHRLVLMTFDYFPGCETVIINHKDGNKANPSLYNLEWSTYSENIKHAYDNKLMVAKCGEASHMSKHTDKQAEDVCKMLMEGHSASYIASTLSVSESFVRSIREKRAWKSIYSKYDLPDVSRWNKSIFNESTVNTLCEYFQNNKRNENICTTEYVRNSLKDLGIEVNRSTVQSAIRIYTKEHYTDISKEYNF